MSHSASDSRKGWSVWEYPGEVHVKPDWDVIGHDPYDTCVCGVTTELYTNESGDCYLYIHHSLDGRELEEAANV